MIVVTGIYLDLEYNHRYSRVDDRPEPEPTTIIKQIGKAVSSHRAYEIKIGRDRMIIIHHGYYHRLKTWNWGDATVYYNEKAY